VTLAERITAVLSATGYRPYAEAPPEATHDSGPFFQVIEGTGATATVAVAWPDATDHECNSLLYKMGIRLHEVGLSAERSAGCLYVSEIPDQGDDGEDCGCGPYCALCAAEDGDLGD
jgi:hypothetical protein